MKNLLFRNLVLLMFFIFIFCKSFTNNSKSNVKFTNKNFNNYEIIDSIIGDFNFDFKSDIIRILKNKDQKVRFELYENGNKKALISSEKLIFNYGYLKPYELDFITLSFENKTILISQEYGTTNPNGWNETYISYN